MGVTRRNIRFYEKEGLLTPARNNQNGYRDYGDADVAALKKIKLLRKLGIPLDEVRRMQEGNVTVGDAMCRHLVCLEREQIDLEQSMVFCRRMKDQDVKLSDLDAEIWLKEMEQMEKKGTTFRNKQRGDFRARRYVPAVVAAAVMVVLMVGLIGLMIWAAQTDPAGAPPIGIMLLIVAVPAVIILGVLLAFVERWRELRGGEEDEARKY